MRGGVDTDFESDDDHTRHFATGFRSTRPGQEQAMDMEEDSRFPFDLVTIHVEGSHYPINLDVEHGTRWIPVSEVAQRLQAFLNFTPPHWLIREDFETPQGVASAWRLPDKILRLPPNKVIHVKVEYYPPASQHGPVPMMMGVSPFVDVPESSSGRRPAGFPPQLQDGAESAPEEIGTSQSLPVGAGIGPSGTYVPEPSAPGQSYASLGMGTRGSSAVQGHLPHRAESTMQTDVTQQRALLAAFNNFCRASMPTLFIRHEVNIGLPPWTVIGWSNDPRNALRDSRRVWTFTGPLRFKPTAASGTWRRSHKTDQAPDHLAGSRWKNRNKSASRKRILSNGVEIKTKLRYFVWDAGSSQEGLQVCAKWRHWTWILHEEILDPLEIGSESTTPEVMGLFTLHLGQARQRPTDAGMFEDGLQHTELDKFTNFNPGIDDMHPSLSEVAGYDFNLDVAASSHGIWQQHEEEFGRSDSEEDDDDVDDDEDEDSASSDESPLPRPPGKAIQEMWPDIPAVVPSRLKETEIAGVQRTDAPNWTIAPVPCRVAAASSVGSLAQQLKEKAVISGESSAAADEWVMLSGEITAASSPSGTSTPPPTELSGSSSTGPLPPADIRRFSVKELASATEGFHPKCLENVMAESFFTYRGVLPKAAGGVSPERKAAAGQGPTNAAAAVAAPHTVLSSLAVSVKCFRVALESEIFKKVIESLHLTMGHPHLEAFLGFAWEGSNQMLVFSRPEGEWLAKVLHGSAPKVPPPSWPGRCLLALGIAEALAFLYERCNIVHGNLSPHSIFVEVNGNVRVHNWSFPAVSMAGAIGNVDSDEHMARCVYYSVEGLRTDPKSDIPALGAIILEIFSGARAYDSSRSGGNADIKKWAHGCLLQLDKFVDSRAQPLSESELVMAHDLVKAALACTLPESNRRPDASLVCMRIRDVLKARGIPIPPAP